MASTPPSLPPRIWQADQGDGTFHNPVLFADYSDPDAIRHGDDFYMTASSFTCTPGLPILHSRDLVNWTLINHALPQVPGEQYRQMLPGCGVWAPAIRFHANRFWIFFPTPDEGIYVISADDPAGTWSAPHLLLAGRGLIDPCPLWDDDGQAYLVFAYAKSRAGIKDQLRVAPMAPDATHMLGEGQIVFHEPVRHPTMEGPKFLKKDGLYYILAPAGGVDCGWQVVMRSPSIYGPYEDRVVLHQGATTVNGPHQGALVDLANGDWWFLHFQEHQPYGRIVHMQPVTWLDGWPMMGADQNGDGIGEPLLHCPKPATGAAVPPCEPATSDDFHAPTLGLQWQWQANHEPGWYDLAPGMLRLHAQPAQALGTTPHLLAQKFPAPAFRVEAAVALEAEPGVGCGLAVVGRSSMALELRQNEGGAVLLLVDDTGEQVLAETASSAVVLQVAVEAGGLCRFGYRVPGQPTEVLAEPFQAREGVWVGAKVGLYCSASRAGATGSAEITGVVFSPLVEA